MSGPILPKEWYGKEVVVESLPDVDTNTVGFLLSTNATGVTIKRANDFVIFIPWSAIQEVALL